MKNYLETGDTCVVTAPEAVSSGEFIKVGLLYGVAPVAADNGASVVLKRNGVFLLPKASGAWSAGDKLFWDTSAKNFTKDETKSDVQAIAFADAASGDTTGKVLINAGDSTRIVTGQHTTVAAADTVVTGLAEVKACGATLDSDPGDDPELVSATIGDQAGTPAAGSIIIKTWKTDGTDPTPVAASTFSKKVNWWASGR